MDARPDIQGDDYGHGHECALVVPFGNCDPHGPAASPKACVRGAPIGSFRATQELPARVDWSRRVGKSWELDPVLLHRRQAGQPERPGDDLSNKTLGIELRRRF